MQTGTSINHYRIVGELGAGGMGQVFRAEDTRLKRQVAIKVLPPELARDPERLARLEREAQVLAALNHPHVAAIYGLEEARDAGGDTNRFLVMELVEGESLAERLAAAGPLPPDTVIEIARGIARGLEAAHEKGIVHRDLKPANVMLGADGAVKVLDFGLAKASDGAGSSASSELSASPTVMGTQAGVILGTASYMSPEQARGKVVDKRADIWAFGCVLFEMLGGRRPFDGDTVTDIIAAVVRAEPDVDHLPAGTPPRLRELVQRCLVKDPAQRLRDIGDARIELDHAHEQPALATIAGPAAVAGRGPEWVAVAALLGLGLGAGVAVLLRSEPPPPPARQAIIDDEAGAAWPLATSPLGDAVVARSSGMLQLRWLTDGREVPLEGSERGMYPAWGADGLLYFTRDGSLRRVDVRAGGTVTVAEPPDGGWDFFALSPDGVAYATRETPGAGDWSLDAIDVTTGTSRQVLQGAVSDRFFAPRQVVDDGNALLGFSFSSDGSVPQIGDLSVELLRLADGTRTALASGFAWPRLLDGDVLLMVDGEQRLVSTEVDLATGKLAGVPVPRLEGVALLQGWSAAYDVADDGSLFYISGGGSGDNERTLHWVDREGTSAAITDKAFYYDTDSRISPDGRYLALERSDVNNVWIHDLQRDTQSPLYTDAPNSFPVWSPDGRRVAVSMIPADGGQGIFLLAVDRSAPPARLTTAATGRFHLPTDWSRDGALLYVDADTALRAGDGVDLWVVEVAEGAEPRPLLATSAREAEGRFSPDGRWVAYESNHSGRSEVYVRSVDGSGGEIPISTDGGLRPSWNPAGGELFYFGGDRRFMSVKVQAGTEFIADVPRDIWTLPEGYNVTLVEPDARGERFLVVRPLDGVVQNRLLAIFNWAQTLSR